MRKENYELEKHLLIAVQEWTPRPYIEPFHWHTCLEIGCCTRGQGWFYFGEKKYRVGEGDIFVVNNLERHIAQSDERNPSTFIFAYFDLLLIADQDRELLLPFVYQPKTFNNRIPGQSDIARSIRPIMEGLLREFTERPVAYVSMMRNMLGQICALLLRHYGLNTNQEETHRVFNLYHKIEPVMTYIKNHFQEELRLEDIARVLNLSVSRTKHLFKEAIGESFKEYLTHYRVNEAKKLLSGTDDSVIEISLKCGFQSLSPFYRAFKKIVGMSPQAYRANASLRTLYEGNPDNLMA